MERGDIQLLRLPQSKSIDAVRFLSPLSAFSRFVVTAVHDPDHSSSAVEIHALNHPNLLFQYSYPTQSRVSSLRVSQTPQKSIIAAATLASSLHFLFADPIEASFESELSLSERSFHVGPISAIDLERGGCVCVSVGEDGRVNLVSVGESRLNFTRVYDSRGLVSYTAARWGSPAEFATGGLGMTVQWWDQRKPGGAVSQFKGNWGQGSTSGIVHSIDIHPSRKHVCVVGGSSSTVFAWDLRWQQQPIILSGVGPDETTHAASASEVWEVQYDSYMQPSNMGTSSSSRILPIMMCSENGVLAVLDEGEEPLVLLAEPCAVNGFDIDPQNPSDVICCLEWESIAMIMRP